MTALWIEEAARAEFARLAPQAAAGGLRRQLNADHLARQRRFFAAPRPPAVPLVVEAPIREVVVTLVQPPKPKLNPCFSFETLQVSPSNHAAVWAARLVATESGEPTYNPLYIHGATGLGKTHLLHAIAHEASKQGKRVAYLSAEAFSWGYFAARKDGKISEFSGTLHENHIVIFDDVQLLRRTAAPTGLAHTVSFLIETGHQVVVAADRLAGDIDGLDERCRARLTGGLSIEIHAPDEALRVEILASRAGVAQLDLEPSVLAYVARMIDSNGRDLRAAVNRLAAHASVTSSPITIDVAESAIRDLVRPREPKCVKIEDVQRAVAAHYGTTRMDILSMRRTADAVLARHVAMYLAKKLTPRSLPVIGRQFGGKDHTSVLHAIRRITERIAAAPEFAAEVEAMRGELEQ